jgi:hypothetical protein
MALTFGAARADVTNPAVRLAVANSAETLFDSADDESALFGQDKVTASLSYGAMHMRSSPQRRAPEALREPAPKVEGPRVQRMEYAFTAAGRQTGLDVDLSIAPRAGVAIGPEGGQLSSAGAEIRLGQRLEGLVEDYQGTTWDRPAWYLYVATDGQALTWAPEVRAAGGNTGVRFQEERILVGDHQVGVGVEANGLQASFSVVNREVFTGVTQREESFVGATVTMKR